MVSAVDDGIGRLLDTLDAHGLAKETIVVFLSDNGAPRTTPHQPAAARTQGGLYQGGVRVPFAMRWTDTHPAELNYGSPVISLDVAATIVARAGAEVPGDKPPDGVDLLPFLTAERTGPPHATLYWGKDDKGLWAARSAEEKLLQEGDGRSPSSTSGAISAGAATCPLAMSPQ